MKKLTNLYSRSVCQELPVALSKDIFESTIVFVCLTL